jgi:hypothetical protein
MGGSVTNSTHELPEPDNSEAGGQLRTWIGGLDVKYRYRPSRNTALQIETEALIRQDERRGGGHDNSWGGYGYVDYRFLQRYNVGAIGEYVRAELEEDMELVTRESWRVGLFAGFAPVEETSILRLVGHRTEPFEGDGFWELTMQLVFSLGPHQPHNF